MGQYTTKYHIWRLCFNSILKMHDNILHTSHSKLQEMATLTLHNGERFCIAEAIHNGSTRLYIKQGTHTPQPTYTESPSGISPTTTNIEQWEMTDDENIDTNTTTLVDGNGLVLLCLVGGRPKKAKRNS